MSKKIGTGLLAARRARCSSERNQSRGRAGRTHPPLRKATRVGPIFLVDRACAKDRSCVPCRGDINLRGLRKAGFDEFSFVYVLGKVTLSKMTRLDFDRRRGRGRADVFGELAPCAEPTRARLVDLARMLAIDCNIDI